MRLLEIVELSKCLADWERQCSTTDVSRRFDNDTPQSHSQSVGCACEVENLDESMKRLDCLNCFFVTQRPLRAPE